MDGSICKVVLFSEPVEKQAHKIFSKSAKVIFSNFSFISTERAGTKGVNLFFCKKKGLPHGSPFKNSN